MISWGNWSTCWDELSFLFLTKEEAMFFGISSIISISQCKAYLPDSEKSVLQKLSLYLSISNTADI